MNPDEFYAHTPPDGEPDKWQTMRQHEDGVTDRAAHFAAAFGARELAHWASWLHDVGKYSPEFQKYLRECDAAKRAGRKPPAAGSAEHKCAGTKLALEMLPAEVKKFIAACVLGHHGGLPVATELSLMSKIESVEEEPGGEAMLETAIRCARECRPELNMPFPPLSSIPAAPRLTDDRDALLHWEMLTRFLFSCLVDADCLDTEQHFSEAKTVSREAPQLAERLDDWWASLQARQEEFRRNPQGSERVNRVRGQVYEDCLRAALRPPGLFTLTVPTGGGKTLSSLAFALAHARAHRRTRIIYAAPYTSIIDQTADTFHGVLGADAVLEHHSAVESRKSDPREDPAAAQAEDAQEQRRRLMAENWDVPLVVTTTVQLLESLFADRTTRCRKLHNVAGGVVILDEVQALPPHLLRPLLSGLRALLDQFHVTLVLCTATQPAITGDTPFRETLGEPTEINQSVAAHFQALKRVTYQVEGRSWDWPETAHKVADPEVSSLVVLNTKKDALALLDALRAVVTPETRLRHLSTLMCGAHRRQVLDEVRQLLKQSEQGGPPVVLVSTQTIEAGVDIDFPRGFRAMGPLDRIIQVAGRVNREGGRPLEGSRLVVFTPLDGSAPQGVYRTGMDTALTAIRAGGRGFDFDSPTVATDYFASLYRSLGDDGLDKEKVQILRRKHDYPEVARKMRLIKDDTIPVLVPYHQDNVKTATLTKTEFESIVDDIRKIVIAQEAGFRKGKGLPRDVWQKIQPLTVAIYTTEQERPNVSRLVPDQLWLWSGPYDPQVGIGNFVQMDISDLIVGPGKTTE